MKNKTRVLHVDNFSSQPHYAVQIYKNQGGGYWSTCRVLLYDGNKTKSEVELEAIEFAQRLESQPEKTETIIYQSEDESTIPSPN